MNNLHLKRKPALKVWKEIITACSDVVQLKEFVDFTVWICGLPIEVQAWVLPRRATYSLLLGRKFLYDAGCLEDHWEQKLYVRSRENAYLVPRTSPPIEGIEPMIYSNTHTKAMKYGTLQIPTSDATAYDPMKPSHPQTTLPLMLRHRSEPALSSGITRQKEVHFQNPPHSAQVEDLLDLEEEEDKRLTKGTGEVDHIDERSVLGKERGC